MTRTCHLYHSLDGSGMCTLSIYINLQGLFLGIMHTTKSCRICINFRLRQDPQVNCNMFPRYIHTWKVGKKTATIFSKLETNLTFNPSFLGSMLIFRGCKHCAFVGKIQPAWGTDPLIAGDNPAETLQHLRCTPSENSPRYTNWWFAKMDVPSKYASLRGIHVKFQGCKVFSQIVYE